MLEEVAGIHCPHCGGPVGIRSSGSRVKTRHHCENCKRDVEPEKKSSSTTSSTAEGESTPTASTERTSQASGYGSAKGADTSPDAPVVSDFE